MPDKPQLHTLTARLEALYQRANDRSAGWLAVLRQTLTRYTAAQGAQASASMAYYTLFSLFPLLLALTITMSLFVDRASLQQLLLTILGEILPDSATLDQFIIDTVNSVTASRTEVGLISVLTLLWSASSAFTTLTYNIDLAWAHKRPPSPIKARAVGLLMIAVIYLFLLVALIAIPLLAAVAARPTPVLTALGMDISWLWSWTPRLIAVLVTLFALTAIYHWVPRLRVPWRPAVAAALLATLALQALNIGLSWYLGTRMERYELIYGSLTAIILLLLWVYLSVTVVFLGAHLCAAIVRRRQERDPSSGQPLAPGAAT